MKYSSVVMVLVKPVCIPNAVPDPPLGGETETEQNDPQSALRANAGPTLMKTKSERMIAAEAMTNRTVIFPDEFETVLPRVSMPLEHLGLDGHINLKG